MLSSQRYYFTVEKRCYVMLWFKNLVVELDQFV
jgi:hypothetical protein